VIPHSLVVSHGPRDAPRVALTFDDGPGAVTPAVLDVLRERGAPATFNVLGARARHGAPLLRRAVAEGHELGVHCWRHRDLTARPVPAAAELLRARAAIRAAAGVVPRVFRPPFGTVSPALLRCARALGLLTVTWDVDPRDFEEPEPETIRARVAARVRPGSIVLLHDDRPGLAGTAAALGGILDDLEERSLETVTVGRLLAGSRPGG
jgi:peptidoglycan/xylan/chitin deacetylase (PgdA/CDA1 family)